MIRIINDIKKLEKKQYEGANVFFQPGYASFVKSIGKEIMYCYSDTFIIPVVITRKLFFKYGQLMSEPFKFKGAGNEDPKVYLNEVLLYFKAEQKLQWFLPTPASAFFECSPENTIKIPFGSHVIDLLLDEDVLWKNVHTKHRNVIKKAEKDGVRIECGRSQELLEDFNSIDIETWSRSNKSASGLAFYKAMIDNMQENAIIYMAYLNDKPQSGAIFFYNKQMCYYMYGANKNNPHTGSGNLLQWKAILNMKERGVKRFSFVGCRIKEDEGSKYHGIQRFKERFGGELVQGYMFKIVFNKWLYLLFDIMVGLKTFIQSGHFKMINDIIDQEYHKWK